MSRGHEDGVRPQRTPSLPSRTTKSERAASTPARIAAALAVLAAFAVAVALLFGGDGGHKYTLMFETGGQLVPGNQVLVAGQVVGTIDEIDLTDDSQAAVEVTMEEPLREGASAVIRSTSLSGVANRYVSLTPGPNNATQIDDGGTISGEDTTAPVDLDQLFNVFQPKQRRALQKFIDGNATAYAGKSRLANRAYKFLNPALSTSEQLFAELSSDSVALQRFLVSGSQAFGALADRRDDLTSLVSNANATLRAIANRNSELDRSLSALPDTLRQGNTTFVNLRSALDDLDPLVAASKPATRNLAPFLRRLRLVSTDAVPVFSDLSGIVARPGPSNDLADTLAVLPDVRDEGRSALPAAIDAMNDSQDNVAFFRPYTPEVFSWLSKFAEVTATYDGNGHYARVQPAAANVFDYATNGAAPDTLEPAYTAPARQYEDIQFGLFKRCPGAGSAPAPDGSNPFLDMGMLSGADCDPADIPPSP